MSDKGGSSSDEEDVHQCGRCKSVFHSIELYFAHKKQKLCKKTRSGPQDGAARDVNEPPELSAVGFNDYILGYAKEVDVIVKKEFITESEELEIEQDDGIADDFILNSSPKKKSKRGRKRKRGPAKKTAKKTPLPLEYSGSVSDIHDTAIKDSNLHSTNTCDNDAQKGSAALPVKRKRGRPRKQPPPAKSPTKKKPSDEDLSCPMCDRQFECGMELDRHLRIEHKLSRYICGTCETPFSDKSKLSRHLSGGPSLCKKNASTTPTLLPFKTKDSNISEKISEKTPNDKDIDFICVECGKSQKTYQDVRDHVINVHPDISPGICEFCGKWFETKYRLLRHLTNSNHDDLPEEQIATAREDLTHQKIKWTRPKKSCEVVNPRTIHSCPSCGQEFKTKSSLLDHQASDHELTTKNTFTCETCEKKFARRQAYQGHLWEEHGILDLPDQQPICPVCRKIFNQKAHFYRHVETLHRPVKMIPTNVIKDIEGVNSDSTWLSRVQCGVNYTCFVCQKSLGTREAMLTHIQLHRVFAVRTADGFSVEAISVLYEKLHDPNFQITKRIMEPESGPSSDQTPEQNSVNEKQATDTLNDDNRVHHVFDPQEDGTAESQAQWEVDDEYDPNFPNNIKGPCAELPTENPPTRSSPLGSQTIRDNGQLKSARTKIVPYSCCYCLNACSTLEELYVHKTEAHNLSPVFHCISEGCGSIFHHVLDYESHHRIHPQNAFICMYCNGHFRNGDLVLSHKSSCHHTVGERQAGTTCHVCQNTFADAASLQDHLASEVHSDLKCSTCSLVLRTRPLLADHELMHAGIRRYLCDTCGAPYSSRLALARHKTKHKPQTQHICEQCGNIFKKKENLRRHISARHSTVKPYACQLEGCDKRFTRKDKLKEHIKSHEGARPFSCKFCGKSYRFKEGLRYHENTHGRTHKFFCQVCSQGFSKPGLLRTHMSEAHCTLPPPNSYPCRQCKQSFSRPERLQRHEEREHGAVVSWKYTCEHCQKGFPGWRSYDTHLKRAKHGPYHTQTLEVEIDSASVMPSAEILLQPNMLDVKNNTLGNMIPLSQATVISVDDLVQSGSIITLPVSGRVQGNQNLSTATTASTVHYVSPPLPAQDGCAATGPTTVTYIGQPLSTVQTLKAAATQASVIYTRPASFTLPSQGALSLPQHSTMSSSNIPLASRSLLGKDTEATPAQTSVIYKIQSLPVSQERTSTSQSSTYTAQSLLTQLSDPVSTSANQPSVWNSDAFSKALISSANISYNPLPLVSQQTVQASHLDEAYTDDAEITRNINALLCLNGLPAIPASSQSTAAGSGHLTVASSSILTLPSQPDIAVSSSTPRDRSSQLSVLSSVRPLANLSAQSESRQTSMDRTLAASPSVLTGPNPSAPLTYNYSYSAGQRQLLQNTTSDAAKLPVISWANPTILPFPNNPLATTAAEGPSPMTCSGSISSYCSVSHPVDARSRQTRMTFSGDTLPPTITVFHIAPPSGDRLTSTTRTLVTPLVSTTGSHQESPASVQPVVHFVPSLQIEGSDSSLTGIDTYKTN